mmetsp:Transcript_33690/g.65246  ORF Transcript_33690/g.65246 Transcript_33690/m.65246 type:complete len:679 (-) Transcript_33690:124-2160(-)
MTVGVQASEVANMEAAIFEDLKGLFVLAAVFMLGWFSCRPGSRLAGFAVRGIQGQVLTASTAKHICEDEEQYQAKPPSLLVSLKEAEFATSPKTVTDPWTNAVAVAIPIEDPLGAEVSSLVTPSSPDSVLAGVAAAECGAHGSAFELTAMDEQMHSFAERHDLSACQRLWRRWPAGLTPSSDTLAEVASAARCAAVSIADADFVLAVAERFGDVTLAETALCAGSRLCSAAWLAAAGARLYAAGVPETPEHAVAVARAYGRERRPDLAVDLWQAQSEMQSECGLDSSASVLPAAELYSAALEVCVGFGDFESALRLTKSACWHAPATSMGQAAFLALSRWLARRQDLHSAQECIRAAQRTGSVVDLATFRAVLKAAARNADMTQARAIFREMISTGLEPDFSTFAAMIRGYCSAGDMDQAMAYLHNMRQGGMSPDGPLFDSLLEGCAHRRLPDLAGQVLADMEAAGVRPSSATLAILVRLHAARGDLEEGLALYQELSQCHGLEPDSHTMGTLVCTCLTSGRHDLAMMAYQNLSSAGCRATARTFEDLIVSCLSYGDLDFAVRLLDEALCLTQPTQQEEDVTPEGAGTSIAQRKPRVFLEPKVIEDVLRLIGRRRLSKSLGMPLVMRLQAAGVMVPEHLAEAMLDCAQQPDQKLLSPLEQRCNERQSWCRSAPSAEPL